MSKLARWIFASIVCIPVYAYADRGVFDMNRWENMQNTIRERATAANISQTVIDNTLRNMALIPSIIKSDANQSEFKLTLDEYLDKTVNQTRITQGQKMRMRYPTLLSRVDKMYGVPPHVMLAFWGMESNYGAVKARHQLTHAFFTLMYEGRRETFFGNQLLALMKIADKNKLDINSIHGSWAGAMGHFQFIPTTLAQYGADGNGDKRIDIINNITDAMFSAGNYLNKLGWNKNEKIVRQVILPGDFDITMLDGKTKLTLPQWAALGVTNPDGTPIPQREIEAGLVADVASINAEREAIRQATIEAAHQAAMAESATYAEPTLQEPSYEADTDIAPLPVITAYLTYPNFYRIKKWNNSNWYAIAIAKLADQLH